MSEKDTDNMDQRAFAFEAAAIYLGGMTRPTLYKLDIPSFKIGRRRYYLREQLDAFLDKKAAEARVYLSYEQKIRGSHD